MEQFIQSATRRYLDKLDDHLHYFSPEQLLSAGYPEFLVKRIRLELIQNLQESINPPSCEWTDMEAPHVNEAWEHFLKSLHQEIRLPLNNASSVLESSLSDLLNLMVNPRAFIPDYLFGSQTELTLLEIRERCEWIVVYPYFSTAIPRFMERKVKNVISKEQCTGLIERLDERITAKYTSLNWAQLFQPWFALLEESIAPELLACFFREKGKQGIARLFEAEETGVNRNRLIEILSRPLLEDDEEEWEAFHPAAKKKEPHSATNTKTTLFDQETKSSEELSEKKREDDVEEGSPESVPSEEMPEEEKDNLLSRYQKENNNEKTKPLYFQLKPDDENEENDQKPLHARLNPVKEEEEERQEKIPIWKRFTDAVTEESDAKKKRFTRMINRDDKPEEDNRSGIVADDKEEAPFNSEKKREMPSTPDEEEEKAPPEKGESNTKTTVSEQGSERFDELKNQIRDKEKIFCKELFSGDENAMNESLEMIARFDNWKDAGKFISKEVFNRNYVDIYSEAALSFTDRMQTYFLMLSRKPG